MLLDEKNPLHNRNMHISGAFKDTGMLAAESKEQDSKLPNGNDSGRLGGSLEDRIFELWKTNPKMKISDAARELGVGERSLYRALERLKSSGRVERVGGKRFGYWKICEE